MYHIGHKCKKLFVILGEECIIEEEVEVGENSEEYKDLHISIHALAGQITPDTIKLLGRVGKHHISILVDTWSTHSFLDPSTTRKLHCELEYTNPLLVTVADGGRIECNSKCFNFQWEMEGHRFSTNVRILKLGGCDMVIGVDLLRKLGPVTFDFENQRIQLVGNGNRITL